MTRHKSDVDIQRLGGAMKLQARSKIRVSHKHSLQPISEHDWSSCGRASSCSGPTQHLLYLASTCTGEHLKRNITRNSDEKNWTSRTSETSSDLYVISPFTWPARQQRCEPPRPTGPDRWADAADPTGPSSTNLARLRNRAAASSWLPSKPLHSANDHKNSDLHTQCRPQRSISPGRQ